MWWFGHCCPKRVWIETSVNPYIPFYFETESSLSFAPFRDRYGTGFHIDF